MPREKDFSRFDDSAALIGSDRPFEILRTHTIPRLHFRKGDDTPARGYDIYLAALPTQVSFEDGPTLGLEAGGRRIFAEATLRRM